MVHPIGRVDLPLIVVGDLLLTDVELALVLGCFNRQGREFSVTLPLDLGDLKIRASAIEVSDVFLVLGVRRIEL